MISSPLESTRQLAFMTELISAHTPVAGDIVQIGATTWGIHGSFPVDGDVIVAEYDSLESARAALAQLPPNWDPERGADRRTTRHDPDPTVGGPAYFLGRDSATWRAALRRRPSLSGGWR
jgi:hypothetical protein